MQSWNEFKKKKPEEKPIGRKILGTYRCQFCPEFVWEATYFPIDEVLKYTCKQDHTNFLEGFKLSL